VRLAIIRIGNPLAGSPLGSIIVGDLMCPRNGCKAGQQLIHDPMHSKMVQEYAM
jgi:hypothetical protein